jgi:hypothetical protein
MIEPPIVKYTANIWKDKYRACKKANKHLTRSNTRLGLRCASKQATIQSQRKLLQSQSKALSKMAGQLYLGVRPKRHKYSLAIIVLCVHFQATLGLSYRQVQEVIRRFILIAQLHSSTPSATSIRNWVRKTAYHRLVRATQVPGQSRILILDESAGIGQEKVLLILQLQQAALRQGVPLAFNQVRVLLVRSSHSWKGEQIKQAIKEVTQGGPVNYVICDRAPNLQKALRLGGYRHVNDCSHLMASYLEHYYKKDPAFSELMLGVGKLRKKWINTNNASLMAPQLRAKARFLNLFEIVDWLEKIGLVWEKLTGQQREELLFVHHYKLLIAELKQMTQLIKHLSQELKSQGITQESEKRVGDLFASLPHKTANVSDFEQKIKAYLAQKRLALPEQKRIYCCSDVIESFFGKFKTRTKQAPNQGLSDDMIVMSLFSGQASNSEVQQAMEEVVLKKVEQWAKENTVPSFAKERKQFWRNLVPKHT